MKVDPIIAVKDADASVHWYQQVFRFRRKHQTSFYQKDLQAIHLKETQMNFYLRVYDNYHYMDESEAYNHGSYNTCQEALSAAKVRSPWFVSSRTTQSMLLKTKFIRLTFI